MVPRAGAAYTDACRAAPKRNAIRLLIVTRSREVADARSVTGRHANVLQRGVSARAKMDQQIILRIHLF